MISWGDIGGKRKPSRFTPVSPTAKNTKNESIFDAPQGFSKADDLWLDITITHVLATF